MSDIRTGLHDVMQKSLLEESQHHDWTYEAIRPIYMPTAARAFSIGRKKGDCSKGVQFNAWWVPGCPDPMGNGFAPYGNSQTICFHLEHLSSAADLKIGDIMTFGINGDEHAAMVIELGAGDPWLWSFGHQGAPNKYRASWDRRIKQFLRLPAPDTPMTPAEKLRAMTGWFSWVAWKLGEGPWKHYGKENANVRPAVPKKISATWWARFETFLKNRDSGNPATTQGIKEA
jgi:hypothetical protein